MAKRQRQFDFIAIMPHGGGRGAMQLSLGQCGDFDFILFRYGKRMEELQAWLNKHLPGYFEVFLDVPRETLLARDYKNVYQQRDEAVTGQTLPPEWPVNPDLRLTRVDTTPQEAALVITQKIGLLDLQHREDSVASPQEK